MASEVFSDTGLAVDPRIESAILQITTRFREPLLLADLASQVGLSPFHFLRLFKTQTGETPTVYLNRIRIEYAAHLTVIMPDAPLLQIALESGFTSAATFARAFRHYFDMTPSEYRQQKKLEIHTTANTQGLKLLQLPDRHVKVERCVLNESALTLAYRHLGQRCSLAEQVVLGIFVDAPFHVDRANCRHYLALEQPVAPDSEDSMLLPGGLYVCVPVLGDMDALSYAILRFKTEQLDPSPYAIASTLAFERTRLPLRLEEFDYRHSERELLIKVRRKNEQVI